MTEDRLTPRRAARTAILLTMGLLAGGLLQACALAPAPGAGPRVYAADITGGAKICQVEKISPADGKTVESKMTLANDRGWCGVPAQQSSGKPFDAGLMSARPAHGNVVIHLVGDQTRIDYTPDRGYVGNDSFAVKLVPGNAIVRIAVTVTPPGPAPKA